MNPSSPEYRAEVDHTTAQSAMLHRYYARKIKIPVTPQFSKIYTDLADWLIALSLSKLVQYKLLRFSLVFGAHPFRISAKH